jgi:hypothetical protein
VIARLERFYLLFKGWYAEQTGAHVSPVCRSAKLSSSLVHPGKFAIASRVHRIRGNRDSPWQSLICPRQRLHLQWLVRNGISLRIGHCNGILFRRLPVGDGAISFVKPLLVGRPWHNPCSDPTVVKRNIRQGPLVPKTFDLRLDKKGIFQIDRSAMARQLRNLRREIEVAAVEMEMVAAEKVFRESLSRALVKEAGKLRVTSRELTILQRLVERAHMPKDPEQPAPGSVPRQRKGRS